MASGRTVDGAGVAPVAAPVRSRRRRALLLVAVAAVLALLAAACETTAEDRATLHDLINGSRAGAGRAPVVLDADLDREADRWAQEMRNTCTLKHRPDLTVGLPAGWRVVGETVAYNVDVGAAHQAFMRSTGHRNIILDSRMTDVGIGAVYGDCWGWRQVWVVYLFIQQA